MILDDGIGNAIDTESKPITVEQQVRDLGFLLRDLKSAIRKEGRTKKRQALQSKYDSKLVEYKKLIKLLK